MTSLLERIDISKKGSDGILFVCLLEWHSVFLCLEQVLAQMGSVASRGFYLSLLEMQQI
jgi:hypothetical protein